MGKPRQDIEDINFIADEIRKFSRMTIEDFRTLIKQHPLDIIYTLDLPSGDVVWVLRTGNRDL